jgi:CheY-like chemotaxis protein
MQAQSGHGETILIVDDDDTVRPFAVGLIQRFGYRALSARNAAEALEILRQGTDIDLLFTDLFMPGGMHGPQLVTEARRLRPGLKVLFAYYSVLQRGLDPGIGQISKPYWPDELAAKLREILDSGPIAENERAYWT